MKQSKLDPCLFGSKRVISINYMDGLLFWAKDEEEIHDLAMKI